MSRFLASLILIVATAFPCFGKEPIRIIDGMVTKISDGDTVQVTDSMGTKVKVRLEYIDCPETEKRNKKTGRISKVGQPYGVEAFSALRGKLERQRVRLEVMTIDKYGRLVSLVWVGNRNINKEMVSEGWAWAYRQYLDRAHASEYIGAEEQARAKKLGLWSQPNPQPPWEFRKQQKKAR